MTQFQVGDRVKYVGATQMCGTTSSNEQDLNHGQCGTVVEVVDRVTGAWPYRVEVDGTSGNRWWCSADELEPSNVPAPPPPLHPPEIADVCKYIRERVAELQKLIEKHPEGTPHYYPLVTGQFELLQLAILLGLPEPIIDETTVVNPVSTT